MQLTKRPPTNVGFLATTCNVINFEKQVPRPLAEIDQLNEVLIDVLPGLRLQQIGDILQYLRAPNDAAISLAKSVIGADVFRLQCMAQKPNRKPGVPLPYRVAVGTPDVIRLALVSTPALSGDGLFLSDVLALVEGNFGAPLHKYVAFELDVADPTSPVIVLTDASPMVEYLELPPDLTLDGLGRLIALTFPGHPKANVWVDRDPDLTRLQLTAVREEGASPIRADVEVRENGTVELSLDGFPGAPADGIPWSSIVDAAKEYLPNLTSPHHAAVGIDFERGLLQLKPVPR